MIEQAFIIKGIRKVTILKLILEVTSLLVAGHKSLEENFGIHFKSTHLYVDGLPYKNFARTMGTLFLVISYREC